MPKWKHIVISVAIVILLCVLPSTAMAHPGRTDSDGGHYNRSTGEYHYHHGMEAHQHPGGVCPYAYGSSYSYPERTATPTQKPTQKPTSSYDEYYAKATYASSKQVGQYIQPYVRPTNTPKATETSALASATSVVEETIPVEDANQKERGSFAAFVVLTLIVLAVAAIVAYVWWNNCAEVYISRTFEPLYQQLRDCQKFTPKINPLSQQPVSHSYIIDQYLDAIKQECIVCMTQYKALQPNGIEMDNQGRPHQRTLLVRDFDPYVVFLNRRSNVYHSARCRYAKTSAAIHVMELPVKATPCGMCQPIKPDLKWLRMRRYIEYLLRIYSKHREVTLRIE